MKFTARQLSPIAIAIAIAALILGVTAYRMFNGVKAAPEVRFSTLKGELVNTSDLRGKVVLVNFWATSCAPCIKEIPALAATYERLRDRGFETIAVAMDYDPPARVKDYAEQNRLPFMVALDPRGDIARRFGEIRLVPTTFIIDRHGAIIHSHLGELDFATLAPLLEKALKAPAT